MKIHFAGKYSGKPEELPNQKQIPGAKPFRELSPEKLSLVANGISLVIVILTFGLGYLRSGGFTFIRVSGLLAAVLSLIPHEFLHALCFKEDVFLYTYFEKGLLFVLGQEDMTKGQFVFMSLFPNLVFGFVPFLIFLFFPSLSFLGSLGALAISAGAGDYINIYNALTQVPDRALIYMYRMSTCWYMPT